MSAIDYLRRQGLAVRLRGTRVSVSPASRLTAATRQYIKAHRLEIIAELASADGLARRCHWRITAPGYRPFAMISQPITHAEAQGAAEWRWPGAIVSE